MSQHNQNHSNDSKPAKKQLFSRTTLGNLSAVDVQTKDCRVLAGDGYPRRIKSVSEIKNGKCLLVMEPDLALDKKRADGTRPELAFKVPTDMVVRVYELPIRREPKPIEAPVNVWEPVSISGQDDVEGTMQDDLEDSAPFVPATVIGHRNLG